MIIQGNPITVSSPRSNYAEQNEAEVSFILAKPNDAIARAQSTADSAVAAAKDAKDTSLPLAGGVMTGAVSVVEPTESAHAASKGYVDGRHTIHSVSLPASSWQGSSAPFIQTVAVAGITAADRPHWGVVYSDDNVTRLAQKEAYALVDELEASDGSVTFTCFEEKPGVALTIQMEVNR